MWRWVFICFPFSFSWLMDLFKLRFSDSASSAFFLLCLFFSFGRIRVSIWASTDFRPKTSNDIAAFLTCALNLFSLSYSGSSKCKSIKQCRTNVSFLLYNTVLHCHCLFLSLSEVKYAADERGWNGIWTADWPLEEEDIGWWSGQAGQK